MGSRSSARRVGGGQGLTDRRSAQRTQETPLRYNCPLFAPLCFPVPRRFEFPCPDRYPDAFPSRPFPPLPYPPVHLSI